MGSAQSARRIQPGGVSPAVPAVSRRIFPAPRSSRPLHPRVVSSPRVPPLRRRARGVAGARGRGRGWGRRGTAPRPATGRRRAHFHRWRCAATGSGTAGKARFGEGGSGGAASPVGAEPPRPECYSPPAAALAESRGRGSRIPVAALSPPAGAPPPARGGLLLSRGGRAGVPRGGRAAPPTARPLSHPRRPVLGVRGRGGLSPVRPGRRRAVGPGGSSPVTRPRGRSRAHGVGGDVGHPPDPSCNTDQGV